MDLLIGAYNCRLEIVACAAETEINSRAARREEVAVDFGSELKGEAEEAGSRW